MTVAVGHCPVIRDESSCPDLPFATTFTVVDATGRVVMTVRSGADGHFRVAMRPGKYVLEAPMKLPRAVPTPVTVDAGHYTDVTMHFDTGVRYPVSRHNFPDVVAKALRQGNDLREVVPTLPGGRDSRTFVRNVQKFLRSPRKLWTRLTEEP